MSDAPRPVWDDELAAKMLGKIVLIGLTYKDRGNRQEQFYGEIEFLDSKRGICLRLAGSRRGDVYWLPPDLGSVVPARPGSYRLRSTGEIIENPDYITSWTVESTGA